MKPLEDGDVGDPTRSVPGNNIESRLCRLDRSIGDVTPELPADDNRTWLISDSSSERNRGPSELGDGSDITESRCPP